MKLIILLGSIWVFIIIGIILVYEVDKKVTNLPSNEDDEDWDGEDWFNHNNDNRGPL